ncbi:cysteine desulfurase [bacterium]|nr:cysteine desulfurase [bacterium]
MWFSRTSKRVYMDYASATPVAPEALSAMREAEALVGNPGAIHADGVEAARALGDARSILAHELQSKPREIIFTSGLTESDTLAIVGFARSLERTRRTLHGTHWVVSTIEHPSVLQSFAEVERMGGVVTHVKPNAHGIITAESVRVALRPETVFVSVGWANSEIGTIAPLREIARVIADHERRHSAVLFHTDAGQVPLYLHPHVHTLGVDLMSLGSNKLHGPHGIGALYVGTKALEMLSSVLFGGGQEKGLRPGTENVALATGFAHAVKVIASRRKEEADRLSKLRDQLKKSIESVWEGTIVNGTQVLPHILNVSFPGVSGEYLTLALDSRGVSVATKSACREGEGSVSHVVEALLQPSDPSWRSRNTIRFSLGYETTEADIVRVCTALTEVKHTLPL